MSEKMKGIFSKLNKAPHFVKLISFAFVSASVITLSLLSAGVTVGYNVTYGGAAIAQVSSKEEFNSAKEIAATLISGENSKDYLYDAEFSHVLTLKSRNETAEDLAVKILDNTAEIVSGNALTVNGKAVAFVSGDIDVNEVLNKKLSSFKVKKYESSSEFVDEVKVVKAFIPLTECSKENLEKNVENLSVKTTVKETVDVKLSFKTVTNRTSSKNVGYYAVTTKGVEGLKQKVENVTYVDGVEVKRVSVEDVVVSEPVNQVVTVGTAPSNSGTSMLFPIPKSSNYFVSTYYGIDPGDGRMHYGMDFAVSRGTPIYAALDGTVVEVGYRNDYGYYVLLQHTNGLKTRYAHNSQNLVKVGQTVARGQTIGLVGSTGRSSGNHLHFEVIVNGNRVNPSNYIH